MIVDFDSDPGPQVETPLPFYNAISFHLPAFVPSFPSPAAQLPTQYQNVPPLP
jgi:hypothetical protein